MIKAGCEGIFSRKGREGRRRRKRNGVGERSGRMEKDFDFSGGLKRCVSLE